MLPMILMMRNYIENLLGGHDEGQGMVEYVMIIGTISLIIVGAFMLTNITAGIETLANNIATAIGG
jgi:Flp pilus assembly pilin Flp